MLTPELLREIRGDFRLDWYGVHGAAHWARVYRHGQVLGARMGADLRVTELFAFLHDSQREDEYQDPGHGTRAADYAVWLHRRHRFELDRAALALLQTACRHHSDGLIEGDITVQVCWDADRLDLGRVGIKPDIQRLATPAARDPQYLEHAQQWSRGHVKRLPHQRRGCYSDQEGITRLTDF
jgi:uncharacterized protein